MIDIKVIRQNPEMAAESLAKRGVESSKISELLDLDAKRRDLINDVENKKKERNDATKEIADKKRNHEDASEVIASMKTLGTAIKDLDESLATTEAEEKYILDRLPNFPADDVPVGPNEDYNQEIAKYGSIREFSFKPKAHYEIGEELGILDFQRAAKVSGSRFVYYVGAGARLERAIYNFYLDVHAKQGYTEVIPPYLVNDEAMYGTSQFPKFIGDSYAVNQESGNLNLIPTAEVPLTNFHAHEILDEDVLPINFTALAPSFRSEAGSAGRDTRGLIRMHQFNKVEMVKYVLPETSWDALEELTANAKELLDLLKLPYHQIVLATGDASFSSAKTYDLEVWMPAQDTYREISSCSNCTDFQARRAQIKYRDENGKPYFVHTLNGSGLAVGRTVAAVLENYQNEDGSVTIPDVLVPYMGGQTKITKEPKH